MSLYAPQRQSHTSLNDKIVHSVNDMMVDIVGICKQINYCPHTSKQVEQRRCSENVLQALSEGIDVVCLDHNKYKIFNLWSQGILSCPLTCFYLPKVALNFWNASSLKLSLMKLATLALLLISGFYITFHVKAKSVSEPFCDHLDNLPGRWSHHTAGGGGLFGGSCTS